MKCKRNIIFYHLVGGNIVGKVKKFPIDIIIFSIGERLQRR